MSRFIKVEERVIAVVCKQMGIAADQVSRSTSFVKDLGANSLDTVELVMEYEDEFRITISDEEAENLNTIGDVIDFVQQKIGQSS